MSLGNKVPVYLVNGFLESGKTTFIQETLSDPYFSDGGKTLLLACEEGEEEYDLHVLESYDTELVQVEGKEAFNPEFLEECRKKYKPTQVMIEYNGMWGMQLFRDMKFPKGWFPAQGITLVDAGTFDLYMQNMKSLFMDMVQDSDLVIFNRCVEGTKAASYKRNIRAVNPRAQVEFEKEGGELFEYEDELPFDINVFWLADKAEDAMGLGMITVIGRCVGARDFDQTILYTKKLLRWDYIAQGTLNILMLLMLGPLLSLYTLSPETHALSAQLVWIHAVFSILIWPLAFVLPNALRAANDVRFTMVVSVASMMIWRLGFSYVLGIGFGMGAVGVWIAMIVDWVCRSAFFVGRFVSGKWKTKYKA